jgi:NADH-quinone oxidoreductase subunit F
MSHELVLFRNRVEGRAATFEEYRASGGYSALDKWLGKPPGELVAKVLESGLRGRGGAGFPTGKKWAAVPATGSFPRYVLCNTDEMEPGTFKDRILVHVDPHLVIEGMILAGYAVQAERAIFFIRPSYETDASLIEREIAIAHEAGYLGRNIRGSGFSFEIDVHRSAGRYICGEASAQVNAIEGNRPNPRKGARLTSKGLWGKPTVVNNIETLSCVPSILLHGPEWFRKLSRTEGGDGTKLFCVSGRVNRPGCYELPMGTTLRHIVEETAGGLPPGMEYKAAQPGGASTGFMPLSQLDTPMDFEAPRTVGQRLGTGCVMVFDQDTCLVGATRNLIQFFARESCGWCTPCRDGLPYILELLTRIEQGEGEEWHIPAIRRMAELMSHAYCAFAPGAAEPVLGLLTHFEDEVRAHLSGRGCPFKNPRGSSGLDIWE